MPGEGSPQRSGPAASNDLRCMPVYEELDNHASVHAAVQNVRWFMHVYVSARVSVPFKEKQESLGDKVTCNTSPHVLRNMTLAYQVS